MTKKFALLLIAFFSVHAFAGDMDFTGYFRAPIGSNLHGGKQIPISNRGSFGNEFRLGNEQGYGELNFSSHLLKPNGDSPAMVDALFTVAINPPLDRQYNDYPVGGGNMQIVQAYLMGRFDSNALYWMGKRFNRWGYAVIDDFFYFADMSGNGAGVEQIKTANGELAFSVLQYTDTTISGTTGNPSKDAIEMRWGGVRLFESDNEKKNFDFWLAAASTAPGSGTKTTSTGTTAVDYSAGKGGALGIRWNAPIAGGDNKLSVQVGTGVMQSLLLDQDAANIGDSLTEQTRYRVVEDYAHDLTDRWTIRSTLVYDALNYNYAGNSQARWMSVGVRPTYELNDHLQLMIEAGYSTVTDDTEGIGARDLTRVTVGPQWGYGKGLATNQVFRATVSYSSWNNANAALVNTKSIVASSGGVLADQKKDITQIGVEAEFGF